MSKREKLTEVCFLGTMLSDYFSGYSFPVIAIPCYNNMTAKDIVNGIKSEINQTWEYLTYGDNAFSKSEMQIFDKYCKELMKDPDKVMITGIEETEDEGEDTETVYSYFSLC